MRFALSCLLAFFLSLSSFNAQAQVNPAAPFEGALSYKIEFEGAQAEAIKVNEPNTEMKITVGEGCYLVDLTGGRYEKLFMFIADSNYEYSIDMSTQRAFRFSSFSDRVREDFDKEPPSAKPTGRTGKVRGYDCMEYRMETENAEFFYYVTDEYKVDIAKFPEKPRSKIMFLIPGLDGRIPIRTIKRMKGLKVTTTLAHMEEQDLEEDNFTIPPDFVVKGRDNRF